MFADDPQLQVPVLDPNSDDTTQSSTQNSVAQPAQPASDPNSAQPDDGAGFIPSLPQFDTPGGDSSTDPFAGIGGGDSSTDPFAGIGGGDPTGSTADPAGQKNPLDVLEELLKESQAKVGGGGSPGMSGMPGMPGGPGAAPPEPEGPTPEQLQQQAELEEKLRQQAILDQQALEQKRIELVDIKQTPQYQARVQQDQEKVDAKQAQSSAGQGFDIKQLEHTKI